ncbi:MAG: hypothetical protein AAF911_07260 [Planctomycetota bacterium]
MKNQSFCLAWLVTLVGVLAVCPAAHAEEAEAPQGYDTPEATYEAARDAFNDRDWEAFVAIVSPASRDEVIGQMALAMAAMAQDPGSDPRLRALVDEYLPRNLNPMDLMMSDNAEAETIRLAKRIGDPEGFFVEAMSLIFAMQYSQDELATPEDATEEGTADSESTAGEGESDEEATQTLDAEITALDDLTIDGETATAMVTITTSTGDQRDPWTFEQHEGKWYLSMR